MERQARASEAPLPMHELPSKRERAGRLPNASAGGDKMQREKSMLGKTNKKVSGSWFTAAHRGDLSTLIRTRPRAGWVDALDPGNWTALMYASYSGRLECVEWLLVAGANPSGLPGASSNPPLCLASESNDASVVRALIKAGAKIEAARGVSMAAPAGVAAKSGSVDVLRCLMDAGCDIETRDDYGYTPLLLAVKHRRVFCLKLLIDAGADLNARAKSGDGAEDSAVGDCLDMVRVERARREGLAIMAVVDAPEKSRDGPSWL